MSAFTSTEGGVAHPGLDLASVAEVRSRIDRFGERYLHRVHTPGEVAATVGMSPSRRDEFLAGRFAAKQAVFKALRAPRQTANPWQLVEVLPIPDGWAEVHLHGELARWASEQGLTHCEVSVTHDEHHAIAFATAW